MNSDYVKRLVETAIETLAQPLRDKETQGYVVLLSAGPGSDKPWSNDDSGAPGLSSAVALALCVEAAKRAYDNTVGPTMIRAVTFVTASYNNPMWAEAAGRYAISRGARWEKNEKQVTALARVYEEILKENDTRDNHVGDASVKARSLVAAAMAGDIWVVNGVTALHELYAGSELDDYGKMTPLRLFDRSTIIAMGKELDIPDYILTQRPSNGSIHEHEASRMMTRFWSGLPFDKRYVGVLDRFWRNAHYGKDVMEGVEKTLEYEAAAREFSLARVLHKGQDKQLLVPFPGTEEAIRAFLLDEDRI